MDQSSSRLQLLQQQFQAESVSRDLEGRVLLIDPTAEDPTPHLSLRLSDGKYRALSLRGQASIDVFGLNRADLSIGRAKVFVTRGQLLCRARDLFDQNLETKVLQCLDGIASEPHASVLHAIIATLEHPAAAEVLGSDIVAALSEPKFLSLVRQALSIPAAVPD